jgi:hypothetical protein
LQCLSGRAPFGIPRALWVGCEDASPSCIPRSFIEGLSSLPTIESGGVMTRKYTIFIGIICVGILSTESSISNAASDVVPKLDTRLSCESHGRKAITHGSSNLSIAACKRSENHAHEVLVKHWSQYGNNDKMNCHGMVTQGGPPSYVELHSCLESRKHAREIREAHDGHDLKKASRGTNWARMMKTDRLPGIRPVRTRRPTEI